MQVNRIQTYGSTSIPGFTALRLKTDSEKYLSSLPKKALSYVDSVGEYLKDTKFYHIDIGKDVAISSSSGDKYYYPHNIQLSDKYIILRARGGYNTISKKIKFDTTAQAKEASLYISEAPTPLVRAARITKYLDEQETKNKITAEEILPNDTHEEIVRKLLQKYKV